MNEQVNKQMLYTCTCICAYMYTLCKDQYGYALMLWKYLMNEKFRRFPQPLSPKFLIVTYKIGQLNL